MTGESTQEGGSRPIELDVSAEVHTCDDHLIMYKVSSLALEAATAWTKSSEEVPEHQLSEVLEVADYLGLESLVNHCLHGISHEISQGRATDEDIHELWKSLATSAVVSAG